MSSLPDAFSPVPPLPIPPAASAEASPAGELPLLEEIAVWREWLSRPETDPLHRLARRNFATLGSAPATSSPAATSVSASAVPPAAAPRPGWDPIHFAPIPFDQFRTEVLALYQPPLRAVATKRRMRTILDAVGAVLGDGATTADLTPELITRLIASRPPGESPYTTNAYLGGLRAACNYGLSQGYLRANPFAFRKKWIRLGKPARKRHHSLEDIGRVLALMKRDTERKKGWAQWRAWRLYALASTVAYTGMRKMEAIRLRREDIDLENRIILLVDRCDARLKTEASAQPVPMPDALVLILAEWLPRLALPTDCPLENGNGKAADAKLRRKPDPGWVFPNSYRTGPWIGGSTGHRPLDRMKRLGERAGVKGFTFLSLRHSWATHAESRWGFSEAMIQRVLRHTNTRTQQHYRHADPTNLRAAVRDLSFGHEPPAPAAPLVEMLAAAAPPAAPAAPADPSKPRQSAPKLDDDDVIELKRLRAGGWSYAALVARFGVAKSTIHAALTGATHAHIPTEGSAS